MTKRLKWSLMVLLFTIAGIYAVTLIPPDKITRANFERIKYGMTLSKVNAILGTSNTHWRLPYQGDGEIDHAPCWRGKIGEIHIVFDSQHLVTDKECEFSRDRHLTGINRIGEWLGLWSVAECD